MPCFKPLTAYQPHDGKKLLWRNAPNCKEIQIPCGQCTGCKMGRAAEWAIRCMHEASLFQNNSYFTLTYAPDHLPEDHSLHHEHFQVFIRSLRKRTGEKLRFYMCGEYGTATEQNHWIARPHYHVLLFGFGFPDKYKYYLDKRHNQIYRSPLLEAAWNKGIAEIGALTRQSAGYVARYILKKQKYQRDDYLKVDLETGEIRKRSPEYTQMSLKPGIGHDWYKKFHKEIENNDNVVIDGKEIQTPKYYRTIMKRDNPDRHEVLLQKRVDQAKQNPDNAPDRLEVREIIQTKRLTRLPRHENDHKIE